MDKLKWSDEWSVGNRLLDDQHREIIRIINLLIENRDEAVTSEIISDALNDLTQFASQHFKSEEKILADVSYPEYDQQKIQHRDFRLKLVQFCTATSEHVAGVPEALLQWLSSWWYKHIHEEDLLYKDFIK